MGGEKTTQQGSSQTSYTASPEERQLLDLQLKRLRGNEGDQSSLDKNLFNLFNTILSGGFADKIGQGGLAGIGGINAGQTKEMVDQSLQDIYPQFQSSGILDSGTAAQISSKTAAGVRNSNAQFNVQAIQQLLNQAIGGSSSLNQNTTAQYGQLGGQLAGLRTQNSGFSGSTIGMNPFLKSFQQSAGQGMGNFFNPQTYWKPQ